MIIRSILPLSAPVPRGVELAAELRRASQQLSTYGLDNIQPDNMSITIIEAGPRVLPALSDRIAGEVHQQLLKLGVQIKLSAAVEEITADGMHTKDGGFIPASLKVWAAGVRGPKFLTELDGLESIGLINWWCALHCRPRWMMMFLL